MPNVTVSIVSYRNALEDIAPLLRGLHQDKHILRWVVVDNGDSDEIRDAVQGMGGIYVRPGTNLGFGRGHNLALKQLAGVDAPYHLILNPDIMFDVDALGRLADVMDSHPDVGLVMPKVVYPDGSIQYLCKLLPAPIDLMLRRFTPDILQRWAQKRIAALELRNFDYKTPVYIPWLSGCFMFTRRTVLEAVGGFDERFFLYMEDLDLCRRMAAKSKLLYWPEVAATHVHQKASYKSFRILRLHLVAAITYFNKWGWFFDSERKETNRATIAHLRAKGHNL
ncbi:MAG: glycosyltransferase family 2 protein [Acidobacteriaceae bacterium]